MEAEDRRAQAAEPPSLGQRRRCSEVESAVALTEKKEARRSALAVFGFHRESDWATKAAPEVAAELHRCDELAVRANAVLTGVRQRICLELVVACAAHLLSLVDTPAGAGDEAKTAAAVELEHAQIKKVRQYYCEAANGQAQLIYFGGIATVMVVLAAIGALWLSLTWATPIAALDCRRDRCSRERRAAHQQRKLRARLRRRRAVHLLPRRPETTDRRRLCGAISFAFTGGLLHLPVAATETADHRRLALLVISFLAGFSERFAQDTLTSVLPESKTAPAVGACGSIPNGKEHVVIDAPAGLAVRTQKHYGWRPDHPDMRDYLLAVEPAKALPRTVSLRSKMPPVYDQGQLGSCTANSIGAILEFNELKQAEADATTPSRLFIYYNERAMEGTVKQDSGAEIRDGIKSVAQLGAPPETDWPYVITKFATKPPAKSYRDALKHEAIQYARVPQTQMGIQNVLAAGYPISFGFTVYESFESDVGSNGIVPMPEPDERTLGGHAVVAVGYKTIRGQLYFECRNSWGPDWGDHGYFWLPAATSRAAASRSDFWVIEQVE